MSRRPEGTAHASARSNCPSRRLLLGGSAAASLLSVDAALVDPAMRACDAWLVRHAEHERLGTRWQEIEDRLFKQHNWARLSRAQRNRFLEKHEMDALYDRMDLLHEQNLALLSSLPAIVATTHRGICGKLTVAAFEVCPEDHPEAHQLIESILRDYRARHDS